ncbi:MAG: site-2 protease family protein [Candidatus Binatia bacterium]
MRPVEDWSPARVEENAAPAEVVSPRWRGRQVPIVNALLFAATLVTTTIAGAFNAEVAPDELAARWPEGLPFSLTLMGVLLAHEMGHYTLARFHGVKVTLPYFLPGPPFLTGTFGAFIRMRSSPPNRRVLFDVGAAGPWAGIVVALPAVVYGLSLSEMRPIPPTFSGLSFGDSLLFKLVARLVVGPIPHGFDIILDPVALAGWFGFLVTLLNLLPVGQLDGGHVIYAMFGRRHRMIARAFLLFTVAVGFLGWSGWFLWAVLMVVVGLDHPPTLDRDLPLDPLRRLGGWLTLVLFIVTFVPVPITTLEGGSGVPADELVPVTFGTAVE